MKYLKLLALFLLPLSFVACSEDEEGVNTGAATVEFAGATMEIKESVSLVNIPITVSGEHNGNIVVTAKLAGNTGDFVLDKNIIITTEKLNIPQGVETVNLEVRLEDIANEAIESGRTMIFEITEAAGATLGANKTCTVELKENNPLEGTYTLSGYSPFDGKVVSERCNLSMEEGVNDKAYIDFGLGGTLLVNLEEVVSGVKYNITIPGAQVIGAYGSYGDVYLMMCKVDWNAGSVAAGQNDITGVFENGVITLSTPLDFGVGYYIPGAGWLAAFVAYEDEDGTTVPVTLSK